jgi:integrase
MGKRQHRCPYYLLKITVNDFELLKAQKLKNDTTVDLYQKQLNSLNLEYQSLKSCLEKIIDIIKPFIGNKQNYSLEEVVEKSFLNIKTKNYVLSLIKKYTEYSRNKLRNGIDFTNGEMDSNNIPNIFDPQNAFDFVTDPKNNYKRGTIKKNLNTLIRYIRLATNNPFLEYNLPVGKSEPSKLKHIITLDELKKFIKFLNFKKLYVIILICMLMYKFGLRVGAISKIKVSDLLPNNVIIFKEKNSKIIKRKLIPETSNKIRELINECEINNNDYLFYFFKFKNNENQRSNFFITKIRNLLYESGAFSISTVESLSSHIFRATYAVKNYKKQEINNIKEKLGHKFISTTINNYINPERRGLHFLEEEQSSKKLGINALKKRILEIYKNKDISDNYLSESEDSLNLEDEGEDYFDDDFDIDNKIFYWTGHFYDDIDFIEYKIKENNDKNKIIINNELNQEKFYPDPTMKQLALKGDSFPQNKILGIKFNESHSKNINANINNAIFKKIGINNFTDSFEILETEMSMISSNKIKNKKELFYLTKEEHLILNKTINLNKKGIFNNIRFIMKDKDILIKADNDIAKNTIITIVGGKVYYLKDIQNIISNKNKEFKKPLILLYFKTANSTYDRYICVAKNSIVNFFFPKDKINEFNLDLLKIVDTNGFIKLIIVAKRIIKKEETLKLDIKFLNK